MLAVSMIIALTRCFPAGSIQPTTEPASASPVSSTRASLPPHEPLLDASVDEAPLAEEVSLVHVSAAPGPGGRPVIEPNTNYIVSDAALDDVGVVMHAALRVLRCSQCLRYLTSGTLKGHMEKHKFRITSAALAAAKQVFLENRIHSKQQKVLTPLPMGPPVQDLITYIGYACRVRDCDYGAVNLEVIIRHEGKIHGLEPDGEGASERPKFTLQTLFHNPEVYFVINPALPTCANPSLVQHLAQDFIIMASEPPPIIIASNDHGRSPLEVHLAFDSLLLAVRESRESLQLLGSLKAKAGPDEDEGIYIRLNGVVSAWYDLVPTMLDGNPDHYDLERVMFHGQENIPRSRYVISQRKVFQLY